MISAQTSTVKPCWLFLNQYQRDTEPEFNGPNGTDVFAEDPVR